MLNGERKKVIAPPTDPHHIQILNDIQADNQISRRVIGENVGLAQPTVGNIIKDYTKSGHIVSNKTIFDPELFGLVTLAFIQFKLTDTTRDGLHKTADHISKQKYVQDVHRIAGQFDILVKFRCVTIKDTSDFIFDVKEFGNIEDSQTIFVLEPIRESLDIFIG